MAALSIKDLTETDIRGICATSAQRAVKFDKMRQALGMCITALSFEGERAAREQDGVAIAQIHEARQAAIAALRS